MRRSVGDGRADELGYGQSRACRVLAREHSAMRPPQDAIVRWCSEYSGRAGYSVVEVGVQIEASVSGTDSGNGGGCGGGGGVRWAVRKGIFRVKGRGYDAVPLGSSQLLVGRGSLQHSIRYLEY